MDRLLPPDDLLWQDGGLLLLTGDWCSATGERGSDPDDRVLSGLDGVLEPREAVGLKRDRERCSEPVL